MANHYSNNFEGASGTTVLTADPTHITPGGYAGGSLLVAAASIKALSTTSDTMRMIHNLPSNARIWNMWAGADDASAAGAFDVGVHETEKNGGAVVDADRFATALAKNVNVEIFNEATAPLKSSDRGKFLWQLIGLTSDPQKQYDITCTPSTTFTTTAIGITLVVNYTLG